MPQAGDHGLPPGDMRREVIGSQRQQVGGDHRQPRILGCRRGELLGGSHDRADRDTTTQELLEDTSTGSSRTPHQQH